MGGLPGRTDTEPKIQKPEIGEGNLHLFYGDFGRSSRIPGCGVESLPSTSVGCFCNQTS